MLVVHHIQACHSVNYMCIHTDTNLVLFYSHFSGQLYLIINNFLQYLCQRDGNCIDDNFFRCILIEKTLWRFKNRYSSFCLFWKGPVDTFRLVGSIQNISTPLIDRRDYFQKSYETGFSSVKQKNPNALRKID